MQVIADRTLSINETAVFFPEGTYSAEEASERTSRFYDDAGDGATLMEVAAQTASWNTLAPRLRSNAAESA